MTTPNSTSNSTSNSDPTQAQAPAMTEDALSVRVELRDFTIAEVLRSVTPGQQVIKIVHDHLVEMLGKEGASLAIDFGPPSILMLVGLQGSGKTTTTGKIALRMRERDRKKVLILGGGPNRIG